MGVGLTLESQMKKFGISPDHLERYDVLCLPENILSAQKPEDIYQTSEQIELSNRLKEAGAKCADPQDLGLRQPSDPYLMRESAELWLGIVLTLTGVGLSILHSELRRWLDQKRAQSARENIQRIAAAPIVNMTILRKHGKDCDSFSMSGPGEDVARVIQALRGEECE